MAELIQIRQDNDNNAERFSLKCQELDIFKTKQQDVETELATWRDKVTCLDAERLHQEETLGKFKLTLQSQKEDNETLREKVKILEVAEKEFYRQKDLHENLVKEKEDLVILKNDLETELYNLTNRATDTAVFTEKLSEKSTSLFSENSVLNTKVSGLAAENERLSSQYTVLQRSYSQLEKKFKDDLKTKSNEIDKLSKIAEEKNSQVDELKLKLEEEKDEIKTIKRKQLGTIKDLTRQLQQVKKRLEVYDKTSIDASSMGSRTSSCNSLDNHVMVPTSNLEDSTQEEWTPIVEVIEIDKQMLVDKIVSLQKQHARKNEKIDFLEDHIRQLNEELKKKIKIIQSYLMKEEPGALSSSRHDINKAEMAKKLGIMASVYSAQVQDNGMGIEMSLEINNKLQAVLEDVLIKNIMLKENIDTLGTEISRLSQENRSIQLKLQSYQNSC